MFILISSCVGACIGSFLGCMFFRFRLTNTEPFLLRISRPSICDYCGKPIAPIDNIPILTYIFLHKKTRCCKKPLGIAQFSFELLGFSFGQLFGFAINYQYFQ